MKQTRDSKPIKLDVDPTAALKAADAFKKISDRYLETLGEHPERVYDDVGGLTAAATNLALAVELYLKALLLIVNHKAPRGHHLWNLFAKLPRDVQQSIRDNYDRNYAANRAYQVGMSLEVVKSDTNRRDPEKTKRKYEKKERDLGSILKESSEMFETWRYIHESGTKGKPTFHRFEYGPLNLICDAVRFHVTELIKQVEERRTK